jgi:hypothetical protein
MKRTRVNLSGPTDLWTASTTVGPMATRTAFRRLVEEEFAALTRDAAGRLSSTLLTPDEIDRLREKARRNVERRLSSTTVVGEENTLDSLIAEAQVEFGSAGAVIDERSRVLEHRKAEVIAAAAAGGKAVDEQSYLRALRAVSDESARQADHSELAEGLRNAELLANAASEELCNRGVRQSDPNYSDLYIAEIESLARSSGLTYGV